MLPKNRRIPRKLFPLSVKKGKVFKNSLFLLKVCSIEGLSRFGFSVSKKVAKNAVVRNRLRRTGYRLMGGYLPEIKQNAAVVLSFIRIPKDDIEIGSLLESILKQSKLIK